MAKDAPKRGCEVKVEAGPLDLNKGDEKKFSSQRYMANKKKGFKDALKDAFKK